MTSRLRLYLLTIPAIIWQFTGPSSAFGATEPYKVDYSQFLFPEVPREIPDDTYCVPYLDFMQEVFDVMDREYYLPVSEELFKAVSAKFKSTVLLRLKDRKNIVNQIKHLGAGLLVSKLKARDDTFSSFIPPSKVMEFKNEILGYALGIGIEAHRYKGAYLINHVELRSDAYAKGITSGDLILSIDEVTIADLSDAEVKDLLFPPLGTTRTLKIFSKKSKKIESVDILTKKFFRETLLVQNTGIDGLYYIKIDHFNRETGPDFKRLIFYFNQQNAKNLIIDLRGNAGGPPLAAAELAGIFLPAGTELFYFQRKERPKAMLRAVGSSVLFSGNLVILIDRGSGSAAELFSGTLQSHKRSLLVGESSAGQTYLKSLYDFDDKSSLILVTSAAYLYNGERYDAGGLNPDYALKETDANLFQNISEYLNEYENKSF